MPDEPIWKRGAIPTPRNILAAAIPHVAIPGVPANFIKIPSLISAWGNNQYGDCVTAEEAFAKACNNPELFISDAEVTSWADKHGFLNGANLGDVLKRMQFDGFAQNGYTYDDGPFYSVDWTNATVLQSAIALGPVKIGVAADQLQAAVTTTNWASGWFGTGFKSDGKQDHCAALCGFGTISWLAQQLNVSVPSGVDGTKNGYALFTWQTIGVIDVASMLAITHEAWLRRPTTIAKVILGDTSPKTPAVAVNGDLIFLAWKGDGNNNLSVMCSADGGSTFGGKYISPQQSSQPPALCVHNGIVFIAWQGIDNDQLNIAQVGVSGSTVTGIVNKVVLHDASPKSPALASLGANLYLAWKGDSNDQLNVMASTDNGARWINKHISPETSPQAPALRGELGILYIAWKGDSNDQLNVAHVNLNGNAITGFTNKVILPDASPGSPALTANGTTLYLGWKGDSNNNLNIESSTDYAASFRNKMILGETSPEPPSLAFFKGSLLIAWKGDSNDQLNVAKVPVFPQFANMQDGWRACSKCRSMFFFTFNGACPAGGQHDQTGSFPYSTIFNARASQTLQDHWRSCKKCQCIHYNLPAACAGGGNHDDTGSFNYLVRFDQVGNPQLQTGWGSCTKCRTLFYQQLGGVCPGGGTHDGTGSFNYAIDF